MLSHLCTGMLHCLFPCCMTKSPYFNLMMKNKKRSSNISHLNYRNHLLTQLTKQTYFISQHVGSFSSLFKSSQVLVSNEIFLFSYFVFVNISYFQPYVQEVRLAVPSLCSFSSTYHSFHLPHKS